MLAILYCCKVNIADFRSLLSIVLRPCYLHIRKQVGKRARKRTYQSTALNFSTYHRLKWEFHVLSFFPGMSFAWLCRNTSESFPELAAGIINGAVDFRSDRLFPGFSNISGQGCYRDGQYLLSNRTDLVLTTSRMIPDETYEIVLVVRKDNRTSAITQLLELDTETIPKLTIR